MQWIVSHLSGTPSKLSIRSHRVQQPNAQLIIDWATVELENQKCWNKRWMETLWTGCGMSRTKKNKRKPGSFAICVSGFGWHVNRRRHVCFAYGCNWLKYISTVPTASRQQLKSEPLIKREKVMIWRGGRWMRKLFFFCSQQLNDKIMNRLFNWSLCVLFGSFAVDHYSSVPGIQWIIRWEKTAIARNTNKSHWNRPVWPKNHIILKGAATRAVCQPIIVIHWCNTFSATKQ